MALISPYTLAVLIPCFNEGSTIALVIQKIQKIFPGSLVVVIDNASFDNTSHQALTSGAKILYEEKKGKGNAMRKAFDVIDADIYVMVDGDDTYDISALPAMIDLLVRDDLAMVVGKRIAGDTKAYRSGHVFGNALFNYFLARLFGSSFTDVFSGYRVFSKAFVQSFPSFSQGFEIESEMTVHASILRLPCREIETNYAARPEGSFSKLSTWRDGMRIAWATFHLARRYKPFMFFGFISFVLYGIGFLLAAPIVVTYIQSGLVPRFPTAILSTGVCIVASISFTVGIVLDNICNFQLEMKRFIFRSFSRKK